MSYQLPSIYFFFDVESAGLYGEAFSVSYLVRNFKGEVLDKGLAVIPFKEEMALHQEDIDWCYNNLSDLIHQLPTHEDGYAMRHWFWEKWLHWKSQGAIAVADCGTPVEAYFLRKCVLDEFEERRWQAPYPLLDLGSVLITKHKDPVGTYPRLEDELPEHDPEKDNLQTSRLFFEHL